MVSLPRKAGQQGRNFYQQKIYPGDSDFLRIPLSGSGLRWKICWQFMVIAPSRFGAWDWLRSKSISEGWFQSCWPIRLNIRLRGKCLFDCSWGGRRCSTRNISRADPSWNWSFSWSRQQKNQAIKGKWPKYGKNKERTLCGLSWTKRKLEILFQLFFSGFFVWYVL